MQPNAIAKPLTLICACLLIVACDDEATSPTPTDAVAVVASSHGAEPNGSAAVPLATEPFTVRAPLDPFFINQPPEFMMRSRSRTDVIIQRLVATPGAGAWHTHPGPSFGIVEQGQVMLTRYLGKGECTIDVYGPGEAYFEVTNQVHRVTILGVENAVEYKARFNTPVGEPFSAPADDPGC